MALLAPKTFAATFLTVVETGLKDIDLPAEYVADPRAGKIGRAIERLGVHEARIVGSGSFGVAAVYRDDAAAVSRVVKLTADETEVVAGHVLVGANLPHVASIYGSWFVRGVKVERWDGDVPERVGVLLQERLNPVTEAEAMPVTEAWLHLRMVMDLHPRVLAALPKREARQRLYDASVKLEKRLRTIRLQMAQDVADALLELRNVGVYSIDVHGGNIGRSGDTFKLFDVGSSSSPAHAEAPEVHGEAAEGQKARQKAAQTPGMVMEGVSVDEIGDEGEDRRMGTPRTRRTERPECGCVIVNGRRMMMCGQHEHDPDPGYRRDDDDDAEGVMVVDARRLGAREGASDRGHIERSYDLPGGRRSHQVVVGRYIVMVTVENGDVAYSEVYEGLLREPARPCADSRKAELRARNVVREQSDGATAAEGAASEDAPPGLVVRNEVFDAHRGETFGAVSAWLDGRRVGNMPWSEYHGETAIKMIEVAPEYRRQGIASAMYAKLREESEGKIDWGGMTPEGKSLYRHLKQHRALEAPRSRTETSSPLPFALVRHGHDVAPTFLTDSSEGMVYGVDILGNARSFGPDDIVGLVNASPAAVYYGVRVEAENAEMRMAAEEAPKKGEVTYAYPGLRIVKGEKFRLKPRGHRFQPTSAHPLGLSAFPEVKPVLLKQRERVPSLESIRMATIFAGLTVHADTREAESTFQLVVDRYEEMHGSFPPVEHLQDVLRRHLPNARGAMYESAGPWSVVVQEAMKRGLRDRDLRRHLWLDVPEEETLSNVGLAKMSFAMMLMGQNVCCLDTHILAEMFSTVSWEKADNQNEAAIERRRVAERISGQWKWAPAKKGRELGLTRYEQVEDALVKGNPFFDASDPISYARCQWTAWEFSIGTPAAHLPWLRVTQKIQTQHAGVDLHRDEPVPFDLPEETAAQERP